MKLFTWGIVSLLLILNYNAHSQASAQNIYGLYHFNSVVIVRPCAFDGTPTASVAAVPQSHPVPVLIGGKFYVVGLDTGGANAIIKFVDYTTLSSGAITATPNFYIYNSLGTYATNGNNNNTFSTRSYGANQLYFLLPLTLLTNSLVAEKITRQKGSLALGAITLPFKLRLQKPGDFAGSFNLGAAVAIKFGNWSYRKVREAIVGAVSISNVNLDESAVYTKDPDVLKELTKSNNFSALSLSAGGMVEFDKVQVVCQVGLDRLNQLTNAKYGWRFQGNAWFSIGFGINIFTIAQEKVAAETEQKK